MSEHEWVYGEDTWVARGSHTPMPGHGGEQTDNRTRYEIKRRLMDADSGEALYYLEYEDGDKVRNQLYTETVLRLNFEEVEPPEE